MRARTHALLLLFRLSNDAASCLRKDFSRKNRTFVRFHHRQLTTVGGLVGLKRTEQLQQREREENFTSAGSLEAFLTD